MNSPKDQSTKTEVKHSHSFSVDTECECGVVLSEYVRHLNMLMEAARRLQSIRDGGLTITNEHWKDLRKAISQIDGYCGIR